MKKNLTFLTMLGLTWSVNLFAQPNYLFEKTPVAKSADKWDFIKYGEVGASLYTGSVNLSIPIYTYKDNDFEIPISLSYSSNGGIGNRRAGILGPDWILNIGGSIAVDIRGIADPQVLYVPLGDQVLNGFIKVHKENYTRDPKLLWRLISQSVQGSGSGMPKPNILYCPDATPNEYSIFSDAEPDIYHFNFLGHSGTFHFGYNSAIYIYNTNKSRFDYKIEYQLNSINSCLDYFKIITLDGYKYYFYPGDIAYMDNGSFVNTSFQLEKIETPSGRCATITYQAVDTVMHCQPYSSVMQGYLFYQDNIFSSPSSMDASMVRSDGSFEYSNSKIRIPSVMRIDNGPDICFEYTRMPAGQRDQYQGSYIMPKELCNTIRLKSITVRYGQNILKTCHFFHQKRGYTNFLDKISIQGEGDYLMEYENAQSCPPLGILGVDHWGYYNGPRGNPFLMISEVNSTNEETIISPSRNPDALYARNGMLRKIGYPTGGYTEFEYEPHNYSKTIKRLAINGFIPKLYSETGICGGLRLCKMKTYRSASELVDSREYEYIAENKSSGVLLYMPRYKISYSAYIFNTSYQENNMSYFSSGMQAYNYTHIEYSQISEKRADGSRTVYQYSNAGKSTKYMDGMSTEKFSIATEKVMQGGMKYYWQGVGVTIMDAVTPIKSLQAERGKLLKTEMYDANAKLVFTRESNYDTTQTLNMDWLPTYLVRKFGYTPVNIDNYKQTDEKEAYYFPDYILSQNKLFSYNQYGQVITESKRDSRGYYFDISHIYPQREVFSGNPVYEAMTKHHIYNLPSEILVYRIQVAEAVPDDPFQQIPPRIQIDGRKYTYCLPNSSNTAIIRPAKIDRYNKNENSWYTETEFTSYDTKGNLTESKDANGITTAYIWGYNGLYLVAKGVNVSYNTLSSYVGTSGLLSGGTTADHSTVRNNCPNALIDFYEYIPCVGISKHINPSGKVLTYSYNTSGKLKAVTDENGKLCNEYLYSPDNKQ